MIRKTSTRALAFDAVNNAVVFKGWAPLPLLHRVNACAAVAKSVRALAILSKMSDLLTNHVRGL